jgi:glycosyltransferase involved in cell wall biosynthesis
VATPDVTIVFETENEAPQHEIRLSTVMDAWKRQTAAARIAEWIVVSTREAKKEEARTMAGIPARWLTIPGIRYYEQKNRGIAQAAGRYVVLSDSDARPEPDWLARALEFFDRAADNYALLTGLTRYAPGPFHRELAIAQLTHQENEPHDTDHFLAHNVILRADIARQYPFEGSHVRLGCDTHLAGRLLAAGYQLRFDPSIRMTHNYGRSLAELWRHCVVIGYNDARFQKEMGSLARGALRNAIGRYRVLARRFVAQRKGAGISAVKAPLSLTFFAAYCVAVAVGYAHAARGDAEPFAEF